VLLTLSVAPLWGIAVLVKELLLPGLVLPAEPAAFVVGGAVLAAAIYVPWGPGWQSVLAAGSLVALAAARVGLGSFGEALWSSFGCDPFVVLAIALSPLAAREIRAGLRRAAELEEARERLARRLRRDLEEANRKLERHGLALEQALEEAEKANLSKARFLAAVSHELRTPLTSILGFAGMLRCGAAGPVTPKQLDYATEICTSAEHLLHLVQGILDHARIEAGEAPLELAEVPVDLLVEVACRQVTPAALEKGIAIRRPPPRGARVVANRQKLLQVLLNLLSNAIKFSAPASEIGVDVADQGERVEFAVWDRGVGIGSQDLERIFEPFEQVEGANRASKKGAGLGLAICRRLVEQHGGTIRVESEPGRGTRFVVALPRIPAGAGERSRGSKNGPAQPDDTLRANPRTAR
jgi:signal transduction histidine kinase